MDQAHSSHEIEVGLRLHQDGDPFGGKIVTLSNGFMSLVKSDANGQAALGIPGSQDNRVAEAKALSFFIQDDVKIGGSWFWYQV